MQKELSMLLRPFPFDLQLFAEGEGNQSSGESSTVEPTLAEGITETLGGESTIVEDTQAGQDNPLLAFLNNKGQFGQEQQTEVTMEQPQETAPETLDIQVDESANEAAQQQSFADIAKANGLTFDSPEKMFEAYKSLQAAFTGKSQELSQVVQLQQQQRADIANLMQMVQGNQGNVETSQGEATQEDVQEAIFNDPELLDRFYESPSAVIMEVANKLVQQQLATSMQPLQQQIQSLETERQLLAAMRQEQETQMQANSAADAFKASHTDIDQYEDAMAEYISNMNPAIKQGMAFDEILSLAYDVAKGRASQPQPTIEQQLNDETFLSQLAENQKLQDMIIKKHVANVSQRANQAPSVLGTTNTTGQAPGLEPNVPKSMKDAGNAFLKAMGIGQ